MRKGYSYGSAVKNPLANAGDKRNSRSIPGSGRSPGRGKWQPTPGQRSLAGYSPRGHKSETRLKRLSKACSLTLLVAPALSFPAGYFGRDDPRPPIAPISTQPVSNLINLWHLPAHHFALLGVISHLPQLCVCVCVVHACTFRPARVTGLKYYLTGTVCQVKDDSY